MSVAPAATGAWVAVVVSVVSVATVVSVASGVMDEYDTCRNVQERERVRMLAAERRDHLLGLLAREGKIVAKDVAADLGISEDSVRRDLRDLAAEGLCQRVYGGALPASPAVVDYAARQSVASGGSGRSPRSRRAWCGRAAR